MVSNPESVDLTNPDGFWETANNLAVVYGVKNAVKKVRCGCPGCSFEEDDRFDWVFNKGAWSENQKVEPKISSKRRRGPGIIPKS